MFRKFRRAISLEPGNNFHGRIHQTFTPKSNIQYLNLNGNQLEGPLPPSLVNCHRLEVLDVGNNMINDTFPHWLGALPLLKVAILRSNRFRGPIGNFNARIFFPKLLVLDLSHNQFTGLLPTRYFENFKAMMQGNYGNVGLSYLQSDFDSYYSMTFTLKGVDLEMQRILITFIALDLSSNLFQGKIPGVVGKFNSLKVLNLSRNNLMDNIPSLFRNLTEVESLDLSFNRLSGKIPNQLASLSFLSVLNLSYNQLVGFIPQGNQFNTFQSDSYIGNPGLCGLPLSTNCIDDEPPSPISLIYPEEDDDSSWFDWKIALKGYGCGLVIGLSMGYIVFTTGKPLWFVMMVESVRFKNVRRMNQSHPRRRN